MSAPVSAAERAYSEIKAMILSGALPVRARLDVERLARAVGLSSMPVRQALARLSWEGLVRAGATSGYSVALWSERELAELYQWRGHLFAMVALRKVSGPELVRIARTRPYAEAFADISRAIEEGANSELRRSAKIADERLHLARVVEEEVLDDVAAEFEALIKSIAERSARAIVLIAAFHRRRSDHAPLLRQRVVVRALPKNGGAPS